MKLGAYAAFATWNIALKNPHAALPIGVAVEKLGLTPTSPDSPGPLRYADAQKLAREMNEAGFQDIQVHEATGITDFDSLDHYWEYVMDVIGPFRAAMQKAEPTLRDQVKTEVLRKAGSMLKGDRVHMTYSSWIVSGQKA